MSTIEQKTTTKVTTDTNAEDGVNGNSNNIDDESTPDWQDLNGTNTN